MWIFLGLGCAFFESLSDLLSKTMVRTVDIWVTSVAIRIWCFVCFVCAWAVLDGTLAHDPYFWLYVGITGPLNIAAQLLYVRALRDSDLSLCLPILKFSPVWVLITAPLINREWLGASGTVGVLLMVLGAYMLNFSKRSESYLAPITALVRDSGTRSMLYVSLLWAVAAPVDKEAILCASPLFYLLVLNGFMFVGLLPFVWLYSSPRLLLSAEVHKSSMLRGVTGLFAQGMQMSAFAIAPVVGVVAMKRLSVLFGMLWGRFVLKETNVGERTLGAVITFVGMCVLLMG